MVVFAEYTWTLGDLVQVEDRAGQQHQHLYTALAQQAQGWACFEVRRK